MGEVGLDEDRLELGKVLEAAVQKDHVHDVVAYVPLSLNLKWSSRVALDGIVASDYSGLGKGGKRLHFIFKFQFTVCCL